MWDGADNNVWVASAPMPYRKLKGLAGQQSAAAERIRAAPRAAFENLIRDYPDSELKEEAQFFKDHGAAPVEPLDFDTWAALSAALLDLDADQRLALLAEVGGRHRPRPLGPLGPPPQARPRRRPRGRPHGPRQRLLRDV